MNDIYITISKTQRESIDYEQSKYNIYAKTDLVHKKVGEIQKLARSRWHISYLDFLHISEQRATLREAKTRVVQFLEGVHKLNKGTKS